MDDQILNMLREELKIIREGQEAIHSRITASHNKIEEKITKGFALSNGRMRKLEGWRNRIVGALSVLTILGTAFVAWIVQYLPM